MDPVARSLLDWYDAHRRALPWRDTVSPYRTWISEVMLQQTRVDTVIPYFERFMARFPTVQDLAAAPLDDVLSLWSGLGYYSRARNMHRAAQQIVSTHGGQFPTTLEQVRALPGVGEYMAGAIGSIALGLDVAAVDGNLHRVLARLHASRGSRQDMWALAAQHLPSGRAGDYNQALMDLGSGTCTPRSPSCARCPLRTHCAAHAAGAVGDYPVKEAKRAAPERAAVGGILWRGGRLLLVRRPAEGLYGGLYDLPGQLLEAGQAPEAGLAQILRERLGLPGARVGAALGSVQHILTHMRLTLHLLAIEAPADASLRLAHYTDHRWVLPDQPDADGDVGLSTLARKALAVAVAPPPRQQGLF